MCDMAYHIRYHLYARKVKRHSLSQNDIKIDRMLVEIQDLKSNVQCKVQFYRVTNRLSVLKITHHTCDETI